MAKAVQRCTSVERESSESVRRRTEVFSSQRRASTGFIRKPSQAQAKPSRPKQFANNKDINKESVRVFVQVLVLVLPVILSDSS